MSRSTAAAADRSLKALFATGLFSDVVIEMQGSTLVVKVTENPIINRVAFEGNKKIEDDKLRDEVQSKPRQVYHARRVQADVDRILTIYRRGGRYNASVEPKIIKLEQGRVDLVFEINEGDVTGVKRISFVGNEAFGDGTLRGKIRTSESAWWRFLSSDDRFDPGSPEPRPRVAAQVLPLRRLCRLPRGFGGGRAGAQSRRLLHHLHDQRGRTLQVRQGRRHEPLPGPRRRRPEELPDDAPKASGTTPTRWRSRFRRCQDGGGSLGYAFVDVRPNIRRNKDNLTVDVTFDIQEGPRVYVERINISGNTRTLDKVIRREFRLAEGDAFSTAKVRRSQQRLQEPRLLREGRHLGRARLGAGQDQPRSPGGRAEHRRYLVRRRLLDDGSGILGDIAIKERNLLGKGQELRLGLSIGTLSTLIDLSFTEPYFLDRHDLGGLRHLPDVERPPERSPRYSDRSIGFALRAGWAYTEHMRQNVRYTLRQTDIYNVQPWASTIVQRSRAPSVVVGGLRDPRLGHARHAPQHDQGLPVAATTMAVGGVLSAPSSTIARRPWTPSTTRRIFEDFVASIGGSAGMVAPTTPPLLRLNNLFFIGGDTLRGFAGSAASVRVDANTTDRWAASYFYTGDRGAQLPLGLPKEIGILGKACVDVGSLWGLGGPAIYGNTVDVLDSMLHAHFDRRRRPMDIAVRPDPCRLRHPAPAGTLGTRRRTIRFSFGTRF